MSAAGSYNKKYVEWTEKFFYRILEPEIRKNDKTTPYIPGSPCGIGHKRGHDRDNVGDTHLWAVWHGHSADELLQKTPDPFLQRIRV